MNIDQLKTMMDIQALRQFQSGNQKQDDPSFSLLFQEVLQSTLSNISQKAPAVSNVFPSITVNDLSTTKPVKIDDQKLKSIIEKAAETYNLPVQLIEEVVRHESNFQINAKSSAGASGLMQLMPETAKSLGVKNIFDPVENVMAGSKYLRQMLDKYNGNIELALAAYNAGPGNVDKYKGIPPFEETKNYVKSIISAIT